MSHTSKEEKELIKLLKKDPENGLSLALDLYGGAVKTICKNILSSAQNEDIEEAISDTFFKLYSSISKYNSKKEGSLKSYIYAIARHTAIDKYRKISKTLNNVSLEETILPITLNFEDEFLVKYNSKLIKEVINSLKSPDREIFILRYYYNEPIKSIAIRLDLPIKKVENILYRGKADLKKELLERGILYA